MMKKNKGNGTIYISGPVSGNKKYREEFEMAERMLKFLKWKVVNPVKHEKEGKEWDYYLKKDIRKLLKCDAIYMMRGWSSSKGARLERIIAQELGMEIIYNTTNDWENPEKNPELRENKEEK